ncbi:hypothetical protein ACWDA3_39105 [Nonomuraea rubra]
MAYLLLTTAWTTYGLSVATLAAGRRVPWRLGRFLRDAHRLGLLRQAGGAYQFRHAALQDRLARRHRGDLDRQSRPPLRTPPP